MVRCLQLGPYASAGLIALAAFGLAHPSGAVDSRGIKATVAPKRKVIDGIPKEWTGAWHRIAVPLRGRVASPDDLGGKATVQYDANYLLSLIHI